MWISIIERQPENGTIVDTKIDIDHKIEQLVKVRNEQKMLYLNGNWYLQENKARVHFFPTHWKRPLTFKKILKF